MVAGWIPPGGDRQKARLSAAYRYAVQGREYRRLTTYKMEYNFLPKKLKRKERKKAGEEKKSKLWLMRGANR